jgi:hypothetical protein
MAPGCTLLFRYRSGNSTMSNLTVEIPKLPKLDKDDLKAIRILKADITTGLALVR